MSSSDSHTEEEFCNAGEPRAAHTKICLVSTSGGHQYQLSQLGFVIREFPTYLVSVDSPDTELRFPGIRKYRVQRILRSPAGLALNWLQSFTILVKERPTVIITTGAGDAFPTVILGAAFGIPILFIESVARVEHPSLFGRLVHRFASTTIVQWPPLKKRYPEATVASPLFKPSSTVHEVPATPSIVVLTGTHTRGFERLLKALDTLLADGNLRAKVFAQIGHSTYIPLRYPYERFLPHEELMNRLQEADVLVTHDGSGSIADGFAAGKPVIVVPRSANRGEVSYRSSSELARHLSQLGWIRLLEDPYRLPDALLRLSMTFPVPQAENLPEVNHIVREFLNSLVSSRKRDPVAPPSGETPQPSHHDQRG